MSNTRREFLTMLGSAVAVHSWLRPALAVLAPGFKAVLFDAFVIFDPRPVFLLAEQLFPGQGAALSEQWRTRQFEYAWLRVLSHNYAGFWQVTRDALVFAANRVGVTLGEDAGNRLMNALLRLKAWPDVEPTLLALRKSGRRLGILSNFTEHMLTANIESAGLRGLFDHLLSTHEARTYKPDPAAYRLGTDATKLRREEILFIAFAGWDATGAKLFGYPSFTFERHGTVSPDCRVDECLPRCPPCQHLILGCRRRFHSG